MQNLILSLDPGKSAPTLFLSQGDTDRYFSVTLTNDTNTYPWKTSLPVNQEEFSAQIQGSTPIFECTKPDGHGIQLVGTLFYNATHPVVRFYTSSQLTAVPGRFPAKVKFVTRHDNKVVFSAYIDVVVEKSTLTADTSMAASSTTVLAGLESQIAAVRKLGVEFITTTNTNSGAALTGVSKDGSLYDGKRIALYLTQAAGANATLNLSIAHTTTGAKEIYLNGTTRLGTHYPINSIVCMTYVSSKGAWYVDGDWNTQYSNATASNSGLMSGSDKAKLDGINVAFGTCTSAADAKDKAVTLSNANGWAMNVGAVVGVKFINTNTFSATATEPVTLNVNSKGAKPIYYGASLPTGTAAIAFGEANCIHYYMYDGTYWAWLGHSKDNNTTYASMSQAEATAGTATTARSITAKVLKDTITAGVANAAGITASTTTPKVDGTAAVGSETKYARGDHVHPTDTTRAALASPTFTGTPKAPTAATATNTTQIATTAFVKAAIAAQSTQSAEALLTTKDVTASISKARATSVSITAPTVSGYKFVTWVNVTSTGWVGSVSIADANAATTNVWNTDGANQTGSGNITATALYVKTGVSLAKV